MTQTIVNAKQIQEKSRRHVARRIGPNWFKVLDGLSNQEYDVNLGLNGGTCSCEWGRHRPDSDHRSGCAHVVAAMNYRAMRQGKCVSVWSNEKDARRQHRPMLSIGDGVILTTRPY